MSGSASRHGESEVARLRGLVEASASGAAAALAELVGRTVLHRQTRVPERRAAEETAPRTTGVFFEAEGHLSGLVGLLMAPASRDTVLRNLLGREDAGHPGSATAASALCELGNIVASWTMSAVANDLGARILLSVPKLVTEDAEAALAGWVAQRRHAGAVLRLESVLSDCEEAFEALLVFVLDP